MAKKSMVSRWTWVAGYLALSAIIGAGAWLFPFGSPRLHLKFFSDAAGITQLYFNSAGTGYSEENSLRQPVQAGNNEIQYRLADGGSLRWDPLESDADVRLTEAQVSIFGLAVTPEMLPVDAMHDVQKLTLDDSGLSIRTNKGSGDPQVSIALPSAHITLTRMGLCAAIGLVLSAWLCAMLRFFWPRGGLLSAARIYFADDARRFDFTRIDFREWGQLFAIAMLGNIYFLANFSLSIDDEAAAIRSDPSVWLGQGRFTVYIVEKFLFPQSAIPYAPYVFFSACMAAAYMLLVRAHRLPVGWKTYLCFPAFFAFPVWWLILEFYSNVPAVGLGLVLVCAAAYLTVRNLRPDGISSAIGGRDGWLIAILLVFAMGAYQTFVLMYLCIVAGGALGDTLRLTTRPLAGATLRHGVKVIAITLASFIAYSAVSRCANALGGAPDQYIDGLLDYKLLLNSPLSTIVTVAREAWAIYTGDASQFGAAMPIAIIVLAWAAATILIKAGRSWMLAAGFTLAVLLAPFLLHFVSAKMPLRATMSAAYVVWLAAIVMVFHIRGRITILAVAVVLVFELQMIGVTSQYQASAEISQAHDRLLAADIYRRIGEAGGDFNRSQPVVIDVYGYKTVSSVYAVARTSATGGSFFGWDNGNLARMVAYMNVVGYRKIQMASTDERRRLAPMFADMPVWPAAHSVKKVGGVFLVRLGSMPDPTHAAFLDAK